MYYDCPKEFMIQGNGMKKTRKIAVIIFCFLLLLILLGIVNFIPTWSLKNDNMHKLEGKWINVYYEKEEQAAQDVFELADKKTEQLAATLGFSEKQNVNVYIYDAQKTMQKKKYGLIGPLLDLDWYIGDNIGTDVILTSPANPGPVHDYNTNKHAVLHEIVHAYISTENPDIHLWLTEGVALYLTNAEPFYKEFVTQFGIPNFNDTKTRNPIKFSKCGGYTFASTYIEYLDVTYGWDCINELLQTEDYETVFNKSQKTIYDEWVNYIENYDQ